MLSALRWNRCPRCTGFRTLQRGWINASSAAPAWERTRAARHAPRKTCRRCRAPPACRASPSRHDWKPIRPSRTHKFCWWHNFQLGQGQMFDADSDEANTSKDVFGDNAYWSAAAEETKGLRPDSLMRGRARRVFTNALMKKAMDPWGSPQRIAKAHLAGAPTLGDSRFITQETTPSSIPTNPATGPRPAWGSRMDLADDGGSRLEAHVVLREQWPSIICFRSGYLWAKVWEPRSIPSFALAESIDERGVCQSGAHAGSTIIVLLRNNWISVVEQRAREMRHAATVNRGGGGCGRSKQMS